MRRPRGESNWRSNAMTKMLSGDYSGLFKRLDGGEIQGDGEAIELDDEIQHAPCISSRIIEGRRFYYFAGSEGDIARILSGEEYPLHLVSMEGTSTIVDIGGHVGSSTLYFHKNFPEANVYTFEPMQVSFKLLKKNTSWSNRVHAFEFGLSNKEEETLIYHSGKWGLMMSSVVKTRDHEGETSVIRLRPVKDVFSELGITQIDVLKIDTEGFEPLLINEMKHMLDKIMVIFLEVHSDAARVYIENLLSPYFSLRHAYLCCLNRSKLMYLNRSALSDKRIVTQSAPALDF
jgi:FkbM family methyltransferase